jgi:hypothetical protein
MATVLEGILPNSSVLSCVRDKRFEKYSQGRSKVAGARPGRPVETATEASMQQVEELIRADRSITIHSVTTALGCSMV